MSEKCEKYTTVTFHNHHRGTINGNPLKCAKTVYKYMKGMSTLRAVLFILFQGEFCTTHSMAQIIANRQKLHWSLQTQGHAGHIRKHGDYLSHGYLLLITNYYTYVMHVQILMFWKHPNGRDLVKIRSNNQNKQISMSHLYWCSPVNVQSNQFALHKTFIMSRNQ